MMKTAEEIKQFIARKPMNAVARNRTIRELAEAAWFYWERERQSGKELGMKPDPEIDSQQAELKKMLRTAGVAKDAGKGKDSIGKRLCAECQRMAPVEKDRRGVLCFEDHMNPANGYLCFNSGGEFVAPGEHKPWRPSQMKGKPAKDRRTQLHRALDCVLDKRTAAKDAKEFEVKQGRSGNWAVFKLGDDYPVSHWFGSQSQAKEEMKRLGGAPSKAAPKKVQEQPDIMGYPWETIQALQRKEITSSQMGSHAAAIRKSKGRK